MRVRSFRLSDYSLISDLLQEALSDPCYKETMQAFAKQLSWDGELVLVAEEQDELVGMVIGTIDDNKGYYYRLAVAPGHRRKGIGKALIEGMKQRFMQRKVKRILVTVDHHNEMVLPVYESAGYNHSDFTRTANRLSIVKKASM
ncbi:GNAT family N-acetyltransferase [Paenibacillus sp. UNC499MF]|uniref:GNAT family N-acetyltransferase n=1 Tax=unclassified Paenibacillus TaxID=185978 RepID=UPI0008A06F2A|nr:GNAT family N-acetyltransferase [Paenibacillus sp. UNC499MF]SEG53236.1 Ribosomal protein S18 acetylase RimI [Paenibacillus sp. UNC499MF]